jgi:ApaG protein
MCSPFEWARPTSSGGPARFLPHAVSGWLESSAVENPSHKIRVDVETSYVEEQSDPKERRFVFAYTITLRNEGQMSAKLLTRHWIITDANGKVQEVRGDGVVGEQPHLKPGQGFRYSSGTMIETPVGAMQGSYQMMADDGERFDAPIAPFRLAMPGILQ